MDSAMLALLVILVLLVGNAVTKLEALVEQGRRRPSRSDAPPTAAEVQAKGSDPMNEGFENIMGYTVAGRKWPERSEE